MSSSARKSSHCFACAGSRVAAWTTLKRCWSGAIGEALMDEIHASKTGRPGYPLLTLLRSLLLGVWYKLSDEQLAASLARNLLFRRFCRPGDHERNKEIAVTRSGGERPFATYKRLYGLAAMAPNIRKGAKFLTLYGIRDPIPIGIKCA